MIKKAAQNLYLFWGFRTERERERERENELYKSKYEIANTFLKNSIKRFVTLADWKCVLVLSLIDGIIVDL